MSRTRPSQANTSDTQSLPRSRRVGGPLSFFFFFLTWPLVVFKRAYFLLIRANGLLFRESTGKKAGHVVAICEEWCMWWRGRQERGEVQSPPVDLCTYECVDAKRVHSVRGQLSVCVCWCAGSGKERRSRGWRSERFRRSDQICCASWWKCERSKRVWVLQELDLQRRGQEKCVCVSIR